MADRLERTALHQFLQRTSHEYGAKLIELRSSVERWLSYIPASFPHYTSHTVDHSDEMIAQVSKLLFGPDNRPTIPLAPLEAYVIGAAAYLHDAGMVVSEGEKLRILESQEWGNWITAGSAGHDRWQQILRLRSGAPPVEATLQFVADLETRFLIAEFVRRHHHLRSATLLTQHEDLFGRFAFGDRQLISTIANVCVSHGLSRDALTDRDRS